MERVYVDTSYPRFSIVITTYKRPLSCLKTLITLYGQSHCRLEEHQIIVINDGSHDEQYEQIDTYLSRLPGDHLYIPSPRLEGDLPQVYGVKNKAIERATRDIIWLLDDDLSFDSHSLFILQLNWMIFRHAHPVMSPYLSNYNQPQHQQEPFSLHSQTEDAGEKMKVYPTFAGLSFLKEDWAAVGGIDERYDRSMGFVDLDFCLTLHELGCNVMQVPGYTVHVDDRETGSHRVRILEQAADPHPNAIKFVKKWGPEVAKLYIPNHEAVDKIAAML